MSESKSLKKLKIALPKGRLFDKVQRLLKDSGFNITPNGRNYRPYIDDPEIEIKMLKPQNIPRLVELGSQDMAFTGYDWVVEEKADVVELIDLGFNPVTLVAAIPEELDMEELRKKKIRLVSQYENISKNYLRELGADYIFIKSYGATEVFLPEDADMMVDNTETGRTIRENNLKIVKELLRSSTRIIANRKSLEDPFKKKKINDMLTVIKSVLDAENRVVIEMNIPAKLFKEIVPTLPSMKAPTVSKLDVDGGYAVKIAVMRRDVRELIPKLKEKGVTDILVFNLEKVIP